MSRPRNISQKKPTKMWKNDKKLSSLSSIKAAFEIVREDESISTDIKEILQHWHKNISNVLSCLREKP